MKLLKDIYQSVMNSFVLWGLGIVILGWGFYGNGWLRVGIGSLFVYLGIETAINGYKHDRQIEKWLTENEGNIIFFYPTKKNIQEKIRKEILPLFESKILEVFYDGPTITGDLGEMSFLIKSKLNFNPNKIRYNPSIIKIEKGEFIIKDELKELMDVDFENETIKIDFKRRISKACR